jgi:hypothetical protein
MEDGPMLGEWAVEYSGTFAPGETYTVRAEVSDPEPKQGRTGRFDLVRAHMVVEGVADCRLTYVLPRR